jgi:transcriptional regulator with XRE-family HTH domain
MKQMDLARKTRLKQSAISQFETGRRTPSFHNLRRLADALEVSADYLLGRSELNVASRRLPMLASADYLTSSLL